MYTINLEKEFPKKFDRHIHNKKIYLAESMEDHVDSLELVLNVGYPHKQKSNNHPIIKIKFADRELTLIKVSKEDGNRWVEATPKNMLDYLL